MRFAVALLGLIPLINGFARTADEPKLLARVSPLPMALDSDFQFRKTKLYYLSEKTPGQTGRGEQAGQAAGKGGKISSTTPSSKSTTVQDATNTYERPYRLFGAAAK